MILYRLWYKVVPAEWLCRIVSLNTADENRSDLVQVADNNINIFHVGRLVVNNRRYKKLKEIYNDKHKED